MHLRLILLMFDIKILANFRDVILNRFGEDPQKSSDLTRIINERQFNRLKVLLDATPKEKIVVGGVTDAEDKYIGELFNFVFVTGTF